MLPPAEDLEKNLSRSRSIAWYADVGLSAFRPAHARCDDARLVAHFRFRLTKTQRCAASTMDKKLIAKVMAELGSRTSPAKKAARENGKTRRKATQEREAMKIALYARVSTADKGQDPEDATS